MNWDDLFPNQTPEQVKEKLAADAAALADATKKVEEWKTHSRTWEDRAKENKNRVDAAEAELAQARESVAAGEGAVDAATAAQLEQRAKSAESELVLTRKLVGMGADAAGLLDSVSFREQVAKLDPESDEYDDEVVELVKTRTQKHGGGPFVPVPRQGARRQMDGRDVPKKGLWEEIHGSDTNDKTDVL